MEKSGNKRQVQLLRLVPLRKRVREQNRPTAVTLVNFFRAMFPCEMARYMARFAQGEKYGP